MVIMPPRAVLIFLLAIVLIQIFVVLLFAPGFNLIESLRGTASNVSSQVPRDDPFFLLAASFVGIIIIALLLFRVFKSV